MLAAILAGRPSFSDAFELPLAEQLIALCEKNSLANPDCGPAIKMTLASQKLAANRKNDRIAPPLSVYELGEVYTLKNGKFN
jgi:hypothetical protein